MGTNSADYSPEGQTQIFNSYRLMELIKKNKKIIIMSH